MTFLRLHRSAIQSCVSPVSVQPQSSHPQSSHPTLLPFFPSSMLPYCTNMSHHFQCTIPNHVRPSLYTPTLHPSPTPHNPHPITQHPESCVQLSKVLPFLCITCTLLMYPHPKSQNPHFTSHPPSPSPIPSHPNPTQPTTLLPPIPSKPLLGPSLSTPPTPTTRKIHYSELLPQLHCISPNLQLLSPTHCSSSL